MSSVGESTGRPSHLICAIEYTASHVAVSAVVIILATIFLLFSHVNCLSHHISACRDSLSVGRSG